MTRQKLFVLATALFFYVSTGYAQTAATTAPGETPNFKVQVWGYIVEDFSARIDRYVELRAAASEGLPPPMVSENPAETLRAERALARRIRAARAGARQGDIFTPDIRAEFRRVLLLEVDARTRWVIMDENPGAFSVRMNSTYPKERPLSSVPGTILALLPRLPEDIQYRFLGPHLVLLDIRANVILDRLPCAIKCID